MIRPVTVTHRDEPIFVLPHQRFTFGRGDPEVPVSRVLAPDDLSISRVAGSITYEGGSWVLTNLGSSKPLHIVDVETRLTYFVPVAAPVWSNQRVLDQPRLDVLLFGVTSHRLMIAVPPEYLARPTRSAPFAGMPTADLSLTDNLRETFVALAWGWLQPYPRYEPLARTYREVATHLGLELGAVTSRFQRIREIAIESGCPGVRVATDCRQGLCGWAIATRLVTHDDVGWLEGRLKSRQ